MFIKVICVSSHVLFLVHFLVQVITPSKKRVLRVAIPGVHSLLCEKPPSRSKAETAIWRQKSQMKTRLVLGEDSLGQRSEFTLLPSYTTGPASPPKTPALGAKRYGEVCDLASPEARRLERQVRIRTAEMAMKPLVFRG